MKRAGHAARIPDKFILNFARENLKTSALSSGRLGSRLEDNVVKAYECVEGIHVTQHGDQM